MRAAAAAAAAGRLLRGVPARRQVLFGLSAEAASRVQVGSAEGPQWFWETLRQRIAGARRRVSLAALYLGADAHGVALARALHEALHTQPHLRVQVVFDGSRARRLNALTQGSSDGTEETQMQVPASSVTVLRDLLCEFPDRFSLHLYRMPQYMRVPPHAPHVDHETPRGTGVARGHFLATRSPLLSLVHRVTPSPFNESLAVFHAKVLAFDDSIIMTGANLSEEYFVSRADRYIVVEDEALANFMHDMVGLYAEDADTVARPPAVLHPQTEPVRGIHTLEVVPPNPARLPFEKRLDALCAKTGCLLQQGQGHGQEAGADASGATVDMDDRDLESQNENEIVDTWIAPLHQCAAAGVRDEEDTVPHLVASPAHGDSLFLASAYLNPPPALTEALCRRHTGGSGQTQTPNTSSDKETPSSTAGTATVREKLEAQTCIVGPAPNAHGFAKAGGAKSLIPRAYLEYRNWFARTLAAAGLRDSHGTETTPAVEIREFDKEGWVFHAKGLWWLDRHLREKPPAPVVSVMGSSNFGRRSWAQDLELNLLVTSTNPSLRKQLQDEVSVLWSNSSPVPPAEAEGAPSDTAPMRFLAYICQSFL